MTAVADRVDALHLDPAVGHRVFSIPPHRLELRDIRAGAERAAGPPDHHAVDGVVGIEPGHDLGEPPPPVLVQGVELVRPVERHHRKVALVFDKYGGTIVSHRYNQFTRSIGTAGT